MNALVQLKLYQKNFHWILQYEFSSFVTQQLLEQ